MSVSIAILAQLRQHMDRLCYLHLGSFKEDSQQKLQTWLIRIAHGTIKFEPPDDAAETLHAPYSRVTHQTYSLILLIRIMPLCSYRLHHRWIWSHLPPPLLRHGDDHSRVLHPDARTPSAAAGICRSTRTSTS
jgi:hypothetical protein